MCTTITFKYIIYIVHLVSVLGRALFCTLPCTYICRFIHSWPTLWAWLINPMHELDTLYIYMMQFFHKCHTCIPCLLQLTSVPLLRLKYWSLNPQALAEGFSVPPCYHGYFLDNWSVNISRGTYICLLHLHHCCGISGRATIYALKLYLLFLFEVHVFPNTKCYM